MADTHSQYSRLVENYRRYRPRYPQALVPWLQAECGLALAHVVADIGAGTGQFSEPLLAYGYRVYAVEPNDEMRRAAEEELRVYAQFTSVAGTAEATTLPDQSINLIVVGNAFHWFVHEPARVEFARILAPQGWVVLLWNLERNDGSPFAQAFEQFWQTYVDPTARFRRFSERTRPEYLNRFFGADRLKEAVLEHYQVYDLAALQGLVASFLKAPQSDDPRYPAMLADLTALFAQHQEHGIVTLEYDTAIVYGQL
jgi:ubiquinone/menaquinone biosynthesis C-methylase UbiE